VDIRSIDSCSVSIEPAVKVFQNSATILFYGVIALIIIFSILV
jgi:hypothetical protein